MESEDGSRETSFSPSILYVEDDTETRQLVSRMLRRKVEILHTAENGLEGFESYLSHKPDIVISDIKMPLMDGIEMSQKIKADNRDVGIILTTAYSDIDFLMKSIEIGIDKYVLKPVSMDALFSAIDKCSEPLMLAKKLRQRDAEKDDLIVRLREALDNVKTLSGLIPICSSCKKIRDDSGYWKQVEEYLASRSEAEFSHGICPDCLRILYPKYYKKIEEKS